MKLYILSAKVAYQSTNLVKFHLSSWKSEILHCGGLLLSDLWFQKWHVEFGDFPPTTQKSENFTPMGYFCPKYMRFELKKYRGVIFHDTEQRCKIWINPDLMVSKMTWGIGWTFIRAPKSLKYCTLMEKFEILYIFFAQSIHCFSKKISEEFCVLQSLNENWLAPWKMT